MPLQASEHFYIVTERMADLPKGLPILRNMDAGVYFKEHAGKLLVGGVGMALAHRITGGHPPFDLWDGDLSRMQPHQNDRAYLRPARPRLWA